MCYRIGGRRYRNALDLVWSVRYYVTIQVGGLGFMTMATMISFIVGKRISLRSRLIMQEALGQFDISGIVRLTRYILMVTFIIEGLGAFLLSFRFIPEYGRAKGIFFSVFHSISAFCNAGFDLIGNGRSLTPYVGDTLVNFCNNGTGHYRWNWICCNY